MKNKIILGSEAMEMLFCAPHGLLEYMSDGLDGYSENKMLIYNIDNPEKGPGMKAHISAYRKHAVNEMRVSRGGKGSNISRFPPGWHGLSFSSEGALDAVKKIYFRLADIQDIIVKNEIEQIMEDALSE